MPTPVRVRGKKGNKRLATALPESSEQLGSNTLKSTRRISGLENLPNELLHQILKESLNLDLALVSPILSYKLNSNKLRRELVILAFVACSCYNGYDEHINYDFVDTGGVALGSVNDMDFQLSLQSSIKSQAWFTPDMYFSVQDDFLQRLPLVFRRLLNQNNTGEPKSTWIFLETVMEQKGWPFEWITNQADSSDATVALSFDASKAVRTSTGVLPSYEEHMTGDEAHMILTKVKATGSHKSCKYVWTFPEEGRRSSSGAVQGFGLDFAAWHERSDPESHVRLFDVDYWTDDKLDLLCCLHDFRTPYDTTLEGAMVAGLSTAIKQKYLPAVYILAKPHWRLGVSRNTRAIGEAYAQEIMNEARNNVTKSRYTEWICQWSHELSVFDTRVNAGYRNEPLLLGSINRHHPVTEAHLLQAMNIAVDSPKTEQDVVNIFRWLAVSFIVRVINYKEDFPEETMQKVHGLSLGDDGAGQLCFDFFNEAMDEIWSAKRYCSLQDMDSWNPAPIDG